MRSFVFLISTLLLLSTSSTADAFVVPSTSAAARRQQQQQRSKTSLDTAPTMVVYWTIKTAIDTIAYGLGATDEVKGTGVWKSFELKREKKNDDNDEESEKKKEKKEK